MEQWPGMGRRREAAEPERAAGPGPRRAGASTPGLRNARAAAGPSDTPTFARRCPSPRRDVRHALSSRRSVRQAVPLHEILGTPKALEQYGSRDSRLPDVPPTFIPGRHREAAGQGNGHAARVTDAPPSVADTAVGARAPTARPDAIRQPASESFPVVRSVYGALEHPFSRSGDVSDFGRSTRHLVTNASSAPTPAPHAVSCGAPACGAYRRWGPDPSDTIRRVQALHPPGGLNGAPRRPVASCPPTSGAAATPVPKHGGQHRPVARSDPGRDVLDGGAHEGSDHAGRAAGADGGHSPAAEAAGDEFVTHAECAVADGRLRTCSGARPSSDRRAFRSTCAVEPYAARPCNSTGSPR